MDLAGKAILRILQDDSDVPIKGVADAVELSVSSVERRIAKMKCSHTIEKFLAIVKDASINRELSIIVEVEIQNKYRHTLDSFQRWINSSPEVQYAWYVTGNMDFVFILSVSDLDDYRSFIERMIDDHKTFIRNYKSSIALKTLKRNTALYIKD